MNNFRSATHRAEISINGILDVYPLEGRKIEERTYTGKNVRVVEHTATSGSPILRSLLNVMNNLPLFRTAFAENGVFHIDCETGTQRYKGYMKIEEVKSLLKCCKFSSKDIEFMINECMQTTHYFLPKVG